MFQKINSTIILTCFTSITFAVTLFFSNITNTKPKFKKTQQDTISEATLKVNDLNKNETNPTLSQVKIQASIIGQIAYSTIELVFYNPNNRILEGQLLLPLKQGQSITQIAIENNDIWNYSVAVENPKAQKVYETLIRQKIDPALLSKVQANIFKLRLYPIPAKGYKKVRIKITETLQTKQNSVLYQYPITIQHQLDSFDCQINAIGFEAIKDKNGKELQCRIKAAELILNQKMTNQVPEQNFEFLLKSPQINDVFSENIDNDYYFSKRIHLQIPKILKAELKNISVYWDISHSGQFRNTNYEIKLLCQYLSFYKNCNVNIVTFAHQIIENKSFSSQDTIGIKNFLNNQIYDGASAIQDIKWNQITADEILLISDAINNYGDTIIHHSNVPIMAINTSKQCDFELLKQLTSKSKGLFINAINSDIELHINLLKHKNIYLKNYKINDNNTSNTNLFPQIGSEINSGFQWIGKGLEPNDRISIIIGSENEDLAEISFTINTNKMINEPILNQIWKQQYVYALELLPKLNRQKIIDFAKQHHLTSSYTSLLVLDRVEDYITHKIIPPIHFKKQYDSAMALIDSNITEIKDLAEIKTKFLERKLWWQTNFDSIILSRGKKQNEVLNQSSINGATSTNTWNFGDSNGLDTSSSSDRVGVGYGNGISSSHVYTYSNSQGNFSLNFTVSNELSTDADGIIEEIEVNKPINRTSNTSIILNAWNPDRPYLKKLNSDATYKNYLELKKGYLQSASFYLECSQFFYNKGEKQIAERILSNLVEIAPNQYQLMRIMAYKLSEWELYQESIHQFRKIANIRPEEPQSYRDLALVLSKNNYHQEAINLLYHIVTTAWDIRFDEIELIALNEINQIISTSKQNLDIRKIDTAFIYPMPIDQRVVINWNTDNCDIDLWVTDPDGEKCFYSNKNTKIGGLLSKDFTGGYGPEEFLIKKAKKGKYKIEINYFGSNTSEALVATNVMLSIFSNYGTLQQKVKETIVELESKKQILEIGSFEVK